MKLSLLLNIIFRGFQALFAIVCLGLSGHILAQLNDYGYTWGSCGLALATSLFSLIVVAFVLVTLFVFSKSATARPLIHLWLVSFAAVAAGKHTVPWVLNFANIDALIGLGVIEWLLFGATAVISIIDMVLKRWAAKKPEANPMTGAYDAPQQPAVQQQPYSYGQASYGKYPTSEIQPMGGTYYPTTPPQQAV